MTQASYKIGVDEIDRQHKYLIDLFDEAVAEVFTNGNWSDVHFALVRLRESMEIYFGYEESMLRMTNYPSVADHANEHRSIIRDLVNLEASSIETEPEIDRLLATKNAMIEHITNMDRDYAKFFADGATIEVKQVGLPDAMKGAADMVLHADFPFGEGALDTGLQ